nr:hypothetical protein CFOL_v3_27320 [Ipomoea batatas]
MVDSSRFLCPALEWNGSDNDLVVHCSKSSSNEGTYVVIPGIVLVVDNGGSETPGRVDASSGNGDGGQVNQENRESNGERGQNLHSAVDKGKDHATKSPSNTLNTHRLADPIRPLDTHNSQDGDVEEQESGHKLSNPSSVEGP